jgi:hypothetical protein
VIAGFSVGGIDIAPPEAAGVTDPDQRREIRRRVAFQDAAVTHSLGGNFLRVFFEPGPMLGRDPEIRELVGPYYLQSIPPVYTYTPEERIGALDRCDRRLDALLADEGGALALDRLDAYVQGVEDFNAGRPADEAVRLLLTGVLAPPKWIVEAPSTSTLLHYERAYSFANLWERYLALIERVYTTIVRRYVTARLAERPDAAPCVAALEICNEPDYEWIPDEHRIERSDNASAEPIRKYVTELHLSQIPESDRGTAGYEPAPWGYKDQDAEWPSLGTPPTPVVDFAWGPKFDWYVRCYAQFQARMSAAVRREADAAGAELTVVSGGVTHNNLDYLIRMARADPAAFAAVDCIAVHPYHWPGHDVWDTSFVSERDTADWRTASPREFARSYLKRFDFLKEVARLVRDPARGGPFFGKRLWISEFGIPTKKLGAFNAPLRQWVQFIRERGEPPLPDGLASAVWEDIWDAFLEQVTSEFLRENAVEAIFLYTLREAGVTGWDRHDDDRGNFALTRRDGTPRMDGETLERLDSFLRSLTARVAAPAEGAPGEVTRDAGGVRRA